MSTHDTCPKAREGRLMYKELRDAGQPEVVHEVMVKTIIAAARRAERNMTRLRDAALSGLRDPKTKTEDTDEAL